MGGGRVTLSNIFAPQGFYYRHTFSIWWGLSIEHRKSKHGGKEGKKTDNDEGWDRAILNAAFDNDGLLLALRTCVCLWCACAVCANFIGHRQARQILGHVALITAPRPSSNTRPAPRNITSEFASKWAWETEQHESKEEEDRGSSNGQQKYKQKMAKPQDCGAKFPA